MHGRELHGRNQNLPPRNCFEQAFLLFDEMTRRGYAFADPATHALVAEYSARERGRGAISSPAARFLVP